MLAASSAVFPLGHIGSGTSKARSARRSAWHTVSRTRLLHRCTLRRGSTLLLGLLTSLLLVLHPLLVAGRWYLNDMVLTTKHMLITDS